VEALIQSCWRIDQLDDVRDLVTLAVPLSAGAIST
jgi:hypothetical protein